MLFIGGDFRRKGGPELLQAWHAGGLAAGAALQLVTDWPAAQDGLPDGVRIVRGITPHSDAWKELVAGGRSLRDAITPRSLWHGLPGSRGCRSAGDRDAHQRHPRNRRGRANRNPGPPGDQSALARAMRALVDSAELRRRMGAAAIARVAGATPAAYAARLHRLITAALDTHDVYAA